MKSSRSQFAFLALVLVGAAALGAVFLQGEPATPVEDLDPIGIGGSGAGADLVDGEDATLLRTLFDIDALPHLGGRVVSTTGSAVAGARVSIPGVGARLTDGDGAFLFEALFPGVHTLEAAFPGLVHLPAPPIRIGTKSVDGVRLTMESEHQLRGVVHGPDARPVEGATVQAILRSALGAPGYDVVADDSILAEATTNQEGRFTLGPLPTGRIDLIVRRTGFKSFGRTIATDTPSVTIPLQRTSGVHGRVVSAETGEPLLVTQASLIVPTRDADGPWKVMDDPSGRSDERSPAGEFSIHPRTRRPMRVVVEGPDFVRVVSDVFRLDGETDHGPIELVASSGPRLTGLVLDDLGAPVSNAEVWIEEPRGAEELVQTGTPFRTHGVRTGANGRFVTEPLATQTYVLHARCEGHRPTHVDVSPDIDVPTLVLPRAGSLAGLVRTRGGAVLPAMWARVRAAAAEPFPVPPVAVVEGRFRFDGLPLGTHTVELFGLDPGRRPDVEPLRTSEVHVSADVVATVVLNLTNMSGLVGRVIINGVGVPFCEVTLTGMEQDLNARCITDAQGGYAFGGLNPGDAWLAVRTDVDLEAHSHTWAAIPTSGGLLMDLFLTTGSASGSVVDAEGGRPLPGITVRLEVRRRKSEEPRLLAELSTDENGRWSHPSLPSGEILVTPLQRYYLGDERTPCDVLSGGDVVAPELEVAKSGQLELLVRTKSRIKNEIEVVVRPVNGTQVVGSERRVGAGRMKLGEFLPGMYEVQVTNLADGTQAQTTASVRERWTETVVVDL